jgi:hypothetical protein
MAKEMIAVALSNELETLAAQFADAMAEGSALQVQLGEMAREAAALLKDQPDNLAAFTDACRQLCLAHGLTEGTVDKTLSNLRGVVRAILGGAELPADATLRAMYDAIPKDPNKGGRKPRQSATGAQDKPTDTGKDEPVKDRPATKLDLVRALFGHADENLLAAVEYAVKHEQMFTAWAEASAKAAQAPRAQLRRAA